MTDINQIFREYCDRGLIEQIKVLLQHPYGINVNNINEYGNTALISACFEGQLELAQILLEHDADPNIANTEGNTALMFACDKGYVEIVKLLLQYKADVNMKDEDNSTALFDACAGDFIDIVRLLLEHNADPNIVNVEGDTALTFAVHPDSIEVARLLLQYGAYPSFALIDASREGIFELVKLLLEYGADPNISNKDNDTAFTIACRKDFIEIIEILRNHGARCACCCLVLKKKKFTEMDYFIFLWALGFNAFATGLFLKRGISFESLIFAYGVSVLVLSIAFIKYVCRKDS
jgi:ankyrin repeat protein